MSRITTSIMVMMLLLNGTATIMEASGINDDLGIEMATGVDDEMQEVVTEMRKGFSPNVNIIESFVALAIGGVRVFAVVVSGVFSAPAMMIQLLGGGSFVTIVVTALAAPLYLLATMEMVFMATGRDPL